MTLIPYQWAPRDYQLRLWKAMESGCRRAIAIWHRRAGKDLVGINVLLRAALERRGLYWHTLPTYAQARKAIWNGQTRQGRPFIEHIPPELIERKRDDEMQIWLKNGSILQLVGADEVNRLVGSNPVGILFSEYALQDPLGWNLMRPILAENGGWALFISTPRGRNHLYRLYEAAKKEDTWFTELLTVDDTNVVPREIIEEDRRMGMPENIIQQEYWCSFQAQLQGSIYGDLIADAYQSGRVTRVPWEPTVPVSTWWDLGMGELTCIWFAQRVGMEHRLIDFLYGSGRGLESYAKQLKEKPYTYEHALLPHDAKVRELGTGRSRVEVARSLGIRAKVVKKMGLEDGIQAVRSLLPSCWFDEKLCDVGLSGLSDYRRQEIEGEYGPNGEPMFGDPLHNWASHAADAFRSGAVGEPNSRWGSWRRGGRSLAPKLPIA